MPPFSHFFTDGFFAPTGVSPPGDPGFWGYAPLPPPPVAPQKGAFFPPFVLRFTDRFFSPPLGFFPPEGGLFWGPLGSPPPPFPPTGGFPGRGPIMPRVPATAPCSPPPGVPRTRGLLPPFGLFFYRRGFRPGRPGVLPNGGFLPPFGAFSTEGVFSPGPPARARRGAPLFFPPGGSHVFTKTFAKNTVPMGVFPCYVTF